MNIEIKLDASSDLDKIFLANNEPDKLLVVTNVVLTSNVLKTVNITYSSGDVITILNATVNQTKVNSVSGTISNSNVGKHLQLSLDSVLTGDQKINLIVKVEYLTVVPNLTTD